jgi:hypothetical protein
MLKANNIHFINDYRTVLNDDAAILDIRKDIQNGAVYIFKNMYDKKWILEVRKYLTDIGKCSLPNYHSIEAAAPNFHRLNRWDERAYVKGCFHQFVFFPWNQDVFNFFEVLKEGFYLKNAINGLPKNKFMGMVPEDGCTARLSFQFYPKGTGGLNKHSDPVDHHQLTVPLLIMSKKGEDFETGGVYVEGEIDDRIFGDDLCDIGDVIFFNAQIPHGVQKIDEHKAADWLSFEGRWMMIFATNKVAGNHSVADARDLENK